MSRATETGRRPRRLLTGVAGHTSVGTFTNRGQREGRDGVRVRVVSEESPSKTTNARIECDNRRTGRGTCCSDHRQCLRVIELYLTFLVEEKPDYGCRCLSECRERVDSRPADLCRVLVLSSVGLQEWLLNAVPYSAPTTIVGLRWRSNSDQQTRSGRCRYPLQ
ncbi:uncharacterized protein OE_5275R (plasmid) [Halobacterium salinarum R1]|uniref:Uncharacterized protein n=1 Tax=Halobacterium salinarum (strain ATCC 29341 / DSM 671 / R1) TaxID=478009 RepID=B0RA07_HALS3|nr:uncharacterized protein OE_5275R [Halobacterium salinarum R1]